MEVESCVYRLFYGDRYIIAKGKTLAGSIFLLQKGYAYFLVGGGGSGNELSGEGHKEADGKNTFYFKFYRFVSKNPHLSSRIELIIESNNGYQLLKNEQIALNKAIRDKKCLNSNIYAYIPQCRSKVGMYGWISKAHYLNFKRFLKTM